MGDLGYATLVIETSSMARRIASSTKIYSLGQKAQHVDMYQSVVQPASNLIRERMEI